ncbi:MAG: coniferyl aldehyde dehydrogenase [Methylorubrum populi]
MSTAVPPFAPLLDAQRAAFMRDGSPPPSVRRDRLKRLETLIRSRNRDLCAAIAQDFSGRSAHETALLELAPLLRAIAHARSALKRWMAPERRATALEFWPFRNQVIYQPLGVVGIMVPWNYPLLLALGPLVDVLAAGNRAMIKPSELLPRTAEVLQEAVSEVFDLEEVCVVTGGVETAEAFSRLPFDHLVFTGSTAVGRKVMAAAAENLTPVTLELGGKSPAIVAPDYPLAGAARDLVFGKMMNAGQTCIAPDYVLAPRERIDALAERILAEIASCYPRGREGDYTSLVGAHNHTRLARMLAECRERGVRVLSYDAVAAGEATRMAPTIVLDPPTDALLMREEIFGPILPILPYDRVEDAIRFVQARPRPLALYLFTQSRAVRTAVLDGTLSGNVTINGTLLHIVQGDLPFGGVGPSGIGAYHGRDGFRRFSHARGITRVRGFNPARLAAPPYGPVARLLARFMMR